MKRGAFLAAGMAALLPAALLGGMALAAPRASLPRFVPPTNGLVLTRTLWRSLHDGGQIMVRRRYAVQFVAENGGYRLEGQLIEATVDAPAGLAALADLERKRPESGLFPVLLDRDGRILDDGALPSAADHARAAEVARGLIAAAPLGALDKKEAGRQIARIAAAPGAIGHIPADLFTPHTGERRERRRLAVPGGMEGEVEVAVTVAADRVDGLPHSVERVVTTMLAGTTRVSREVWSFDRK